MSTSLLPGKQSGVSRQQPLDWIRRLTAASPSASPGIMFLANPRAIKYKEADFAGETGQAASSQNHGTLRADDSLTWPSLLNDSSSPHTQSAAVRQWRPDGRGDSARATQDGWLRCCLPQAVTGRSGDVLLELLDRCMPKPSFRWSDHLSVSSIRGVYTLKFSEEPYKHLPPDHQKQRIDGRDVGLMHAHPSLAHEQLESLPVWLHIYHVRGLTAIKGINLVSRDILGLGGIFHSGVELRGLEWCFGATRTARSGVFCNAPGQCPFHHYSQSVYLGTTRLAAEGCLQIMLELAREWCGLEYQLLQRNCNHFSFTLAQHLGLAAKFPEWLLAKRSLFDLEAAREQSAAADAYASTEVPPAEGGEVRSSIGGVGRPIGRASSRGSRAEG